ncbi:MAG: hypothetical protein ACI8RD_004952 [Bacillariaceae sp.]
MFRDIAKHCSNLEELNLGSEMETWKYKFDDMVDEIAETFPSLTTIDFSKRIATDIGVRNMLQKSIGSKLLSLRIEGTCIGSHYLSDTTVKQIARRVSFLRSLHTMCLAITLANRGATTASQHLE